MTLVPSLGTLLLLGCCVQLECFIVFYFVMFDCHLVEACSSLMRDRKEVDLRDRGRGGGEEVGEVEIGETITRIYYKIKRLYFQQKKNMKKICEFCISQDGFELL